MKFKWDSPKIHSINLESTFSGSRIRMKSETFIITMDYYDVMPNNQIFTNAMGRERAESNFARFTS